VPALVWTPVGRGFDQVELANIVDKRRAATPMKPNDWQFAQKGGKRKRQLCVPIPSARAWHRDDPGGIAGHAPGRGPVNR
jgi:hypothetical protein